MPPIPITGLWTSNTPGRPNPSSGGYVIQPPARHEQTDNQETVGVLSRTLVRSPAVQWIYPARIRHKDKNDTLFIGGDYVQIRQLLPHNQLYDVATKADFGSPIRAARVFGEERRPAASVLKWAVKEEPPDDNENMAIDGEPTQTLPPQILALTLESQKLVFLFATEGPLNQINFICRTRELPLLDSYPHLYGKHLAVDPKSRAMAISAQTNFCAILSLKPMQQLQDEMWENGFLDEDKFKPILEEYKFQVEGIILKMEFLSVIEGEEDTVNLLLLVSRNKHTFAQLYQWDVNTQLRNLTDHRAQRLHTEEEVPLLLVPLTKNASFMIISATTISIWTDIAYGPALRHRDPLSVLEGSNKPAHFANSRKQPLITYWARPGRHRDYNSEHDDLYLCREDGVVQLVEIKPLDLEHPVEVIYHIGPLDGSIDTAFAILDTGEPGGDDVLVACGDMSDVGVYTIGALNPPVSQQALPNWSPILDLASVEGVDQALPTNFRTTSSAGNRASRNRIFTISGRGDKNGTVNELRYGLEARIALRTENAEHSSVIQIWALKDPAEQVLYLLASYPWQSTLMHISMDEYDLDYGYGEENTGLDLSTQTLAAGNTPDGIVIQLTETSIRATILVENGLRYAGDSLPDGAKIIAAAVRGEAGLFTVVVRRGKEQSLYCGKVDLEDDKIRCQLAPSLTLSEPITSVYIEVLGGAPCVIMGTANAKIQIVPMTPGGLAIALEEPINLELTDTENAAVASVAIISSSSQDRNHLTLLCGLRSGNLVHFTILLQQDFSSGHLVLHQTGFFKLGDTTARVIGDDCDACTAFVTCGQDFWKFSYASDLDSQQYVLESIFLTDRIEPYLKQGPIIACLRVGMFPYLGRIELGGSLICIHGQEMAICTLETTAKAVPRRLKINITPNRVVYVKHLNKLIVAGTVTDTKVTKEKRKGSIVSKKRWVRPTLRVVDPDLPLVKESHLIESENDSSRSGKTPSTDMPSGKAGERIFALLAWSPSNGNKTWQFVVAGTKIERRDNSPRGRLLTFSVKDSSSVDTDIVVKARHQIKFESPVYSIAAWRQDSLVFCTGKSLIMQRLDLEEGRWHRVASFDLTSPGVALSILEPLISVNTAGDSIFILEFKDSEFHPCGADRIARSGQHLVTLNHSTVVASNKTCSVAAFKPPLDSFNKTTAKTVFEALLHTSVTRLAEALIRPTWMLDRRVILGGTADGTLYQFTLLNKFEHRLLQFVQNMAKRDRQICPFPLGGVPLGRNHLSEQDDPVHMHIDGDTLSRVVEFGVRHFQSMLSQDPVENPDWQDFDSANARIERFSELAVGVVGAIGEEDKVVAVMGWMRTHLQLVL